MYSFKVGAMLKGRGADLIFPCVGAASRVVRARRRIRAVRGEGGGGDRHAAATGQSHTARDSPELNLLHCISCSWHSNS